MLTIIIDAPSDKIQSVVGRLTLHFQTRERGGGGGGQTKLGKENLVDPFVAKQNVNGSPVQAKVSGENTELLCRAKLEHLKDFPNGIL